MSYEDEDEATICLGDPILNDGEEIIKKTVVTAEHNAFRLTCLVHV